MAYLAIPLLQIVNPVLPSPEGSYNAITSPLAPLIARLWQTMVIIGALLLLLYLIWGATDWITSGGDQEKLKNARHKILDAVTGMAILAASFAIALFLEWIFGFSIVNVRWPTP